MKNDTQSSILTLFITLVQLFVDKLTRPLSASGHSQHVLLPAAADRARPPRLSQPGVDVQVPGAWRALHALHPQQASARTTSPSLYLPGVCCSVQRVCQTYL